jgi:hypothetical protein
MKPESYHRRGETGSAFIISVLVLFVLSVLGMALMLTTTTETDISANYRWGEMAFFNADAALEYGKNILGAYALRDGDLRNALPPPRGPGQMMAPPADALACGDASVAGCRDYQYDQAQNGITTYIGRVLRDTNGRILQTDFRQPVGGDTRNDIDSDGIFDIEGAVTLWIRRPVLANEDYGFSSGLHDRAILTAEGVAPNAEYASGLGRPGSVRRLEMTISLSATSGVASSRYRTSTSGSEPGGSFAGNPSTGGGGWGILQQLR